MLLAALMLCALFMFECNTGDEHNMVWNVRGVVLDADTLGPLSNAVVNLWFRNAKESDVRESPERIIKGKSSQTVSSSGQFAIHAFGGCVYLNFKCDNYRPEVWRGKSSEFLSNCDTNLVIVLHKEFIKGRTEKEETPK